jgi:hypothetical protein
MCSHDFQRHLYAGFCLVAFACTLSAARAAQEGSSPPSQAPPPMKFVSRDEREQLSAAKDPKTRTRVSLDLAESRLHHAEEMTSGKRFDDAAAELGSYQGLVEDAIHFLNQGRKASGKIRDLYRRIEITLRSHAPRLESIRRATPNEYAVHVRDVVDYTKNARAEALNGFYGDTVLGEETVPKDSPSASATKPKDAPLRPEEKQH